MNKSILKTIEHGLTVASLVLGILFVVLMLSGV